MFKLGKAQTPVPEEALPLDFQLREETNISTVAEEESIPPDTRPDEEPGLGTVAEEQVLLLEPELEEHPNTSALAEVVTAEISATPRKDIDAVRELILGLHPSIVPELISGDSVATLIASIAPAQQAYANIVSKMHVPAGGNPIISFDGDSLTTDEKIRRGLSAHQRKG